MRSQDSAGNFDTAVLVLTFMKADYFPPQFDEKYYKAQIFDANLVLDGH